MSITQSKRHKLDQTKEDLEMLMKCVPSDVKKNLSEEEIKKYYYFEDIGDGHKILKVRPMFPEPVVGEPIFLHKRDVSYYKTIPVVRTFVYDEDF